MWFIFALSSGVMYTISGLITRRILKGVSDAWAFSFWFSAIGAIICVPIMMSSIRLPHSITPWIFICIVGILIVAQNLLSFSASKYLPPSISGTITKLRIVWVFLLSLIFMHEAFSLNKFIGVIFTVAAGAILTFSSKGIYSKQGILYALSATGIYAIVIQLYGPLLKEFNAPTLTFFIFLIPTLLNALCMPNSLHRIAALWSIHRYTLLFACAAGGLANVCMNSALSSGNATQTLVIIESFLIVTLVGEHVLLHEQDNLMKKCISVLLAIIGAVLLKIA